MEKPKSIVGLFILSLAWLPVCTRATLPYPDGDTRLSELARIALASVINNPAETHKS